MILQQQDKNTLNYKFVTTKLIFIISICVVGLTILTVWLSGLSAHRTLYLNSILSVSLLSASFFSFLLIGLYCGIKLKDNIGKIADKIKLNELPDVSGADLSFDLSDIGDGIEGVIVGVFSWILFSLLLLLFIWLFGTLFWAMILIFIAMLYWIFFRALRLVFKNSSKCKGDIVKSLAYSFTYTLLYSFWIYGIIIASHYLN